MDYRHIIEMRWRAWYLISFLPPLISYVLTWCASPNSLPPIGGWQVPTRGRETWPLVSEPRQRKAQYITECTHWLGGSQSGSVRSSRALHYEQDWSPLVSGNNYVPSPRRSSLLFRNYIDVIYSIQPIRRTFLKVAPGIQSMIDNPPFLPPTYSLSFLLGTIRYRYRWQVMSNTIIHRIM